jgi:hypothetical protein
MEPRPPGGPGVVSDGHAGEAGAEEERDGETEADREKAQRGNRGEEEEGKSFHVGKVSCPYNTAGFAKVTES